MHNFSHWPQNTDGILISNPLNIFYITGFMGSFGLLMLHKSGQKTLITDGRYKILAQELSQKNKFRFKLFDENFTNTFAVSIRGSWAAEDTCTMRQFTQFKEWFSLCDWRVEKNFIETIRRTKTETEIAHTQAAAAHTDQCITKLLSHLKIGITEHEVSNIVRNLLEETSEKESFENIVAFGENSAKPHHTPSHKRLELDTPILIDCGARKNGYCSDMTRNFWFGNNVCTEYQNAYDVLLKTQNNTNKKLISQTNIKTLCHFARKELGPFASYFVHSLGHGTGLNVHESPSLSKKSTEQLQLNDIVTNEPGLYFDGKFGIRIEDQVVVKETFHEDNVLTTFSKKLTKV